MKHSSPYEERALLQAISTGSEKAFRDLYDAYFPRLSAYIYSFCKSSQATEEIIQEVFIRIWINRAGLPEVEIPEAYILSIARNKTIDSLRRMAKESTLIRDLREQLPADGGSVDTSMSSMDIDDLRKAISQALAGLSPQKEKIFRLSKDEGLDHDEISHIMQLSRSTVKNHLSETLRHIRRHLSFPGIKKI